jgi:hypothetical protein
MERARLTEEVQTLSQALANAERELVRAREGYDAFRRQHGIADLSVERQRAIEDAAQLRAQAELARADTATETARAAVGAVATSSAEARRLIEMRAQLAQERARLTDDHPRVQALKARIEAMEGVVANRTPVPGQDVRTGITREAAAQRQTALEDLAQEARDRVARLSQIDGEASALLAAVQISEGHRTRLTEELAVAQDAARSPETDFRVAAPAVVADSPVGTGRRLLIATLAFLFCLLVGLTAILWTDLRGLRVRTAVEAAYWGGGPVIGTTSWPVDKDQLKELIHELDDFAPDARGRTLVVAAREQDAPLAAELAAHLSADWQPPSDLKLDDAKLADEMDVPKLAPGESVGTALARLDVDHPLRMWLEERVLITEAWTGKSNGPQLRRAARLADRVLVVVASGELSAAELSRIRAQIGREDGVGFVVVGIPRELSGTDDRSGKVEEFWFTTRG